MASTAKTVELSFDSPESFQHAIEDGLSRANKTLEHVKGFWIKNQELVLQDGNIKAYRVHAKVTFKIND